MPCSKRTLQKSGWPRRRQTDQTGRVMNPVELFQRESDPVLLNAGDALFWEGEAAVCMYVLLEGTADITVGKRVVETAGPGALLGEMALIDQSLRSASVIAKTPCRLARIDLRRFHFLVQQTPFFATHVMKVLVERVRQLTRQAAQS